MFLVDFLFNRRWWLFRWQKLTRGFSDADAWNLDHTIAEFVLPRLKVFRQRLFGFPGHSITEKEWEEILDKMIFSMQAIVDEWDFTKAEMTMEEQKKHWEKIRDGLELFGKWFRDLWE